MAPPVTPSPHRFLPPSSTRSQNRSQLPPSTLRRQVSSSSQRFRPTPRFAAPSASDTAEAIDSPTSSPIASQAHQPRQSRPDDIHSEQSQHDATIAGSDEAASADDDEDDDLLDFVLPPSKRKRLSPSPTPDQRSKPGPGHAQELVVLSSSPPTEQSPPSSPIPSRTQPNQRLVKQSEPVEHSRSAPRFQFPGSTAPQTQTAPRIGDQNAPLLRTSRPGFVLPPQEENAAESAILPEVFSPHKKGSKIFAPGGMASTVRSWVLELESVRTRHALGESAKRRGAKQDQGRQIVAASVSSGGSGAWTVHVSEEEQWLLIGARGYGGADARSLTAGSEVNLKPPTWTVDIEGQKWGVAIAWSIVG